MSTRAFFLGTVLLLCAFLLSVIVSVSLPALPILDIVRCHFTGDASPHVSTDTESIKEIRVRHFSFRISPLSNPSPASLTPNFHSICHSLAYGERKFCTVFAIELTRSHRAYCIYDSQSGHRTCINPGAFHRLDRFQATQASFRRTWLHCAA